FKLSQPYFHFFYAAITNCSLDVDVFGVVDNWKLQNIVQIFLVIVKQVAIQFFPGLEAKNFIRTTRICAEECPLVLCHMLVALQLTGEAFREEFAADLGAFKKIRPIEGSQVVPDLTNLCGRSRQFQHPPNLRYALY